MRNRVIAVLRDSRYCPSGPQADADILKAVADRLNADALIEESRLSEADLAATDSLVLTMGRLPETLALLKDFQAHGGIVINDPSAVEICVHRARLQQVMQDCHVALPPAEGAESWWLKRGDPDAHGAHDIIFCKDARQLVCAQEYFRERGVKEWVVSPHVEGTSVKFYGVGQQFFRCYTEEKGERAEERGERVDMAALHADVMKIVNTVNIDIYGGDCIVDKNGRFYFVDFNDWPSFRYCRLDAAEAIARRIRNEK